MGGVVSGTGGTDCPSAPGTSHGSESGFERSSRWEKMRPASSLSWSIEPGLGSAVWRTWYPRLKVGSSIHTGRPAWNGGDARFCPERGKRRGGGPIPSSISSYDRGGAPESKDA